MSKTKSQILGKLILHLHFDYFEKSATRCYTTFGSIRLPFDCSKSWENNLQVFVSSNRIQLTDKQDVVFRVNLCIWKVPHLSRKNEDRTFFFEVRTFFLRFIQVILGSFFYTYVRNLLINWRFICQSQNWHKHAKNTIINLNTKVELNSTLQFICTSLSLELRFIGTIFWKVFSLYTMVLFFLKKANY